MTYSQLGEKISQKSSGEHLPKRPGGLKVQFGETSCVETAAVLPVIANDQSLYKDIYVTEQMVTR